MSTITVDLSNTGDSIIQVQLQTANVDKYLGACSTERTTFIIGQTYNIKVTEGRTVNNINYTPSTDGATLTVGSLQILPQPKKWYESQNGK